MSWESEKDELPVAIPNNKQPIKRKSPIPYIIVVIVLCLIKFAPLSSLPFPSISHCNHHHSSHSGDLQWKELVEGSNIFHANLTLPLDYNNPSAGNLTIALNKLPATVDNKLGSILINPGGPGGSGTDLTYRKGQEILDAVDGHYDIIGFDPRGINWTTPNFHCGIADDKINAFDKFSPELLSAHNNDNASYGEAFVYSELAGLACSRSEFGKYVSTALVATDMLHISRALGDEKLNYWGFSYGSILGNTFAQMYPSFAGRMIVDGVMDGEDYYAGSWLSNLENTDDVAQAIYDSCAASEHCPIPGKSGDEIRNKVEGLLKKLHIKPEIVYDEEKNTFYQITYSDYKNKFFSVLYSPSYYQLFANTTQEFLSGNPLPFYKAFLDGPETFGDDGGYATRCGDVVNSTYPQSIGSPETIKEHITKLSESSKLWADNWLIALGCSRYTQFPVLLWDGPFVKVDAPMLLIGNTFDPVTPLSAARKMSQFYTKSAVIHQDGVGHCSLAQKSNCTTNHVKRWFLEGILPDDEILCPVDDILFETSDSSEIFISRMLSI